MGYWGGWLVCLVFASASAWAGHSDFAFGRPGIAFPWATSEKQGIGTAYEEYDSMLEYSSHAPTAPVSRVWFTVARGILTEVFYPRADMAQTRDTQFLVTDGKTFFHEEQRQMEHEVERVPGAPLYLVTSRDPGKRYSIQKAIWADPDSDAVIEQVRIERYVDGLHFYVLHKPAAANSLFGDSATSEPFLAGEDHFPFTGWQGLSATIPFRKRSVGYVGVSDGFTDLSRNLRMTWDFFSAPDGNVSLTGELDLPLTRGTSEFSLFLFFGPTRGSVLARHDSIAGLDVTQSRTRYVQQWRKYLSSLELPIAPDAPGRRRVLAEQSALVLKTAEDKTYSGSIVASMSHPWGEKTIEQPGATHPERNAAYHVVWPRDVYHIANAFLAVGDTRTARAVWNRLKGVAYGPKDGSWEFGPRRRAKEGSFPQNFWVDGTALYGGYQSDETAMPVLLAYRLWKRGLLDARAAWPVVERAAAFLADMGPWTQNERWEETYGISPNSAGYVIAALVAASEMAASVGFRGASHSWMALADQWSTKSGDNLDTWTFTTSGRIGAPFGNGRYYLRLAGSKCDKGGGPVWDAVWNPNEDGVIQLANFFGEERFRNETEIVDASFLALVRLGVRAARSSLIRDSIAETDSMLRRDTARGSGWYRYRFDGYGEERRGRLWPLLTGERLQYELQFLRESGEPHPDAVLETRLAGFESFASDEGIFAEQVWDEGPLAGRPNGSAAPLSWSHAEYLQTLKSVRDGAVFEEIPSVRARYGN